MNPAEFAAIREALHFSHRYLANRWGVARQSVQRWESGYRKIPDEIAKDLNNLFRERENTINKEVEYIEKHKDTEKYIRVPKGFGLTTSDYPAPYIRSIALEVSKRTGVPITY